MDNNPAGDNMGGALSRRLHHYGPSDSAVYSENMETTSAMCTEAGLPVELLKTVGPTMKITFWEWNYSLKEW